MHPRPTSKPPILTDGVSVHPPTLFVRPTSLSRASSRDRYRHSLCLRLLFTLPITRPDLPVDRTATEMIRLTRISVLVRWRSAPASNRAMPGTTRRWNLSPLARRRFTAHVLRDRSRGRYACTSRCTSTGGKSRSEGPYSYTYSYTPISREVNGMATGQAEGQKRTRRTRRWRISPLARRILSADVLW